MNLRRKTFVKSVARLLLCLLVLAVSVVLTSKEEIAFANDFQNTDLTGSDFSHKDLHGADFSGANLQRVNFKDADLSGANLSGAQLSGTDLTGANLDRANLSGAFIDAATLTGITLVEANLSNSLFCCSPNLSSVNLDGANLRGAYLEGAVLDGANLAHAILFGTNLAHASLRHVDFTHALYFQGAPGGNLDDSNLSGLKLKAASFRSASLRRANLGETNLWDADFSDSVLQGADLRGAGLWKANFQNADLRDVDLEGATWGVASQQPILQGATFSRANLPRANLRGYDLTRTKFTSANLAGANLVGVQVLDTDFSGADLSGAQISYMHGSGATFTSAVLAGAVGLGLDEKSFALDPGWKVIAATLMGPGANLDDFNFDHLQISGVDFTNATCARATFSDTVIEGDYVCRNDVFVREIGHFSIPTISGLGAVVGTELSAIPGKWDDDVTFEYQWFRQGPTPIEGATARSYIPSVGDVNLPITVRVTGLKSGYLPKVTWSNPVTVLPGNIAKRQNPMLVGSCRVGGTLTANTGTWDAGVSLKIQWNLGGATIPGTMGTRYTLQPNHLHGAISVRVIASKPGYDSVSLDSQPCVVQEGIMRGTAPSISGLPRVGRQIRALVGRWAPYAEIKYQWFANGKEIPKATNAYFRISNSYRSSLLSVAVLEQSPGYLSTKLQSRSVKVLSR